MFFFGPPSPRNKKTKKKEAKANGLRLSFGWHGLLNSPPSDFSALSFERACKASGLHASDPGEARVSAVLEESDRWLSFCPLEPQRTDPGSPVAIAFSHPLYPKNEQQCLTKSGNLAI